MTNNEREKIEQASERVGRMNRIFDKLILPIIGFTVLIIVVFAAFGDTMLESCLSTPSAGTAITVPTAEPQIDPQSFYAKRALIMAAMESNRESLEAFGYEVSDQYSDGLSARWQYDPTTYSIDYFSGGRVYAIIRRDMAEDGAGYSYIAMGVYSERMITVEVGVGNDSFTTVFTDEGFTEILMGSEASADEVLQLVPREALVDLLVLYKSNTQKYIEH